MKAKKLFPDLSFKRLWDKIKDLENKVGESPNINLDELNKNLNMRYNIETDSVEIFYNNKWNFWKYGNLQTLYLYTLGSLSLADGYSFKEQYATASDQTYARIQAMGTNYMGAGIPTMMVRTSANNTCSATIPIDLTNREKITFDFTIWVQNTSYSGGELTFGISADENMSNSFVKKAYSNTTLNASVQRKTIELDVTQLSGEYYIKVYNKNTAAGYVKDVHFWNITVE